MARSRRTSADASAVKGLRDVDRESLVLAGATPVSHGRTYCRPIVAVPLPTAWNRNSC